MKAQPVRSSRLEGEQENERSQSILKWKGVNGASNRIEGGGGGLILFLAGRLHCGRAVFLLQQPLTAKRRDRSLENGSQQSFTQGRYNIQVEISDSEVRDEKCVS